MSKINYHEPVRIGRWYDLAIVKRHAFIRVSDSDDAFGVAPGRPYGRVEADCLDTNYVRLLTKEDTFAVVYTPRMYLPWRFRLLANGQVEVHCYRAGKEEIKEALKRLLR